jgi:hypothetical protein
MSIPQKSWLIGESHIISRYPSAVCTISKRSLSPITAQHLGQRTSIVAAGVIVLHQGSRISMPGKPLYHPNVPVRQVEGSGDPLVPQSMGSDLPRQSRLLPKLVHDPVDAVVFRPAQYAASVVA